MATLEQFNITRTRIPSIATLAPSRTVVKRRVVSNVSSGTYTAPSVEPTPTPPEPSTLLTTINGDTLLTISGDNLVPIQS